MALLSAPLPNYRGEMGQSGEQGCAQLKELVKGYCSTLSLL